MVIVEKPQYYLRYAHYLKRKPQDIPAFRIIRRFLDSDNSSLLDVGCGLGYWSEWLRLSNGASVIGVDSNSSALKMGKHLYGNTLVRASALELPFRNEAFDEEICINLLEHLDKPEIALKEMKRVLKPDGQAIFSTPDTSSLYCKMIIHDKGHIQAFTVKAFLSLISKHFLIEAHKKSNTAGRFNRFLNDQIARFLPCDIIVKGRLKETESSTH